MPPKTHLGLAERRVAERRRIESRLREFEERHRALFENALDAILMVDHQGRYLDANPAAVELLGYSREELLGLTFWDVTPPQDHETAGKTFRHFAERGAYVGDYRILRKDGAIRDAEFRSVANILPGLHIAIVRDVTERRRAEEELRHSQQLLEEAERVAHVGCWQWDLSENRLTWSDETYRLFGLTRGDFLPSFETFLARMHPEDRSLITKVNETARRVGGSFAYDARILRPDGELRFIHVRGHAVSDSDGRVIRLFGIAQDITERRHEEEVRRALLNRMIAIHEEERARLSRELHDGTGQALAALLMGLRRIEDARSLAVARRAASHERALAAQALDELGRMARGLRPAVLDDIGLKAALERLAADQAWLFGFEVSLDADALGRRRLPREIETALYRVTQEALANAARHAAARHVKIVLERDPKEVGLTVSDDGCGFESERSAEAGHLGLHGIRERMALVGGRAEVVSAPGAGTTVAVLVPLPRQARVRYAKNARERRAAAGKRRRP